MVSLRLLLTLQRYCQGIVQQHRPLRGQEVDQMVGEKYMPVAMEQRLRLVRLLLPQWAVHQEREQVVRM